MCTFIYILKKSLLVGFQLRFEKKKTLEQLNENKEMIDKYKKELTVIRQISSKKTNDASNQTVNIVAPMATRVTNKR